MNTKKQTRFPTCLIVAFASACIVLTVVAGAIHNPGQGMQAAGAVGVFFLLGLFLFIIHADWSRQLDRPMRARTLSLFFCLAAAATITQVRLHPLVPSRSWLRLPLSLLGIWGVVTIASVMGAFLQLSWRRLTDKRQSCRLEGKDDPKT